MLARDDDSSESALSENVKALGWHSTNVLVRVGVETFWYFGLAQTSRALTRALVAKAGSSQFYALRCGLGAITKQLLTHPNITLRCSCPVATISCHPSTQQLIVEGQTYDAAVVATTANVATKLCTSTPATAALLTPRQQDFLASQQYVHKAWHCGVCWSTPHTPCCCHCCCSYCCVGTLATFTSPTLYP